MPERFLYVSHKGFAQFVDIEIDPGYKVFLETCHDLLDCRTIDQVPFANGTMIMTIDDFAKIAQKPVNRLCTRLYQSSFDTINGDALIGAYGLRNGESDIVGLSPAHERYFATVCQIHGIELRPIDGQKA